MEILIIFSIILIPVVSLTCFLICLDKYRKSKAAIKNSTTTLSPEEIQQQKDNITVLVIVILISIAVFITFAGLFMGDLGHM